MSANINRDMICSYLKTCPEISRAWCFTFDDEGDASDEIEYDEQIKNNTPAYFWSGVICHDLAELICEIRKEFGKGLKGSFKRVDTMKQMSETDGENAFLIDLTVRFSTHYYEEIKD